MLGRFSASEGGITAILLHVLMDIGQFIGLKRDILIPRTRAYELSRWSNLVLSALMATRSWRSGSHTCQFDRQHLERIKLYSNYSNGRHTIVCGHRISMRWNGECCCTCWCSYPKTRCHMTCRRPEASAARVRSRVRRALS